MYELLLSFWIDLILSSEVIIGLLEGKWVQNLQYAFILNENQQKFN